MNIGNELKTLRKSKGLTAKELALKAGIAQSSVSDIENNKTSPSVETLGKILDALDVSISDFFAVSSDQLPADLLQLIEAAKTLTTEERQVLTQFLQTMKQAK